MTGEPEGIHRPLFGIGMRQPSMKEYEETNRRHSVPLLAAVWGLTGVVISLNGVQLHRILSLGDAYPGQLPGAIAAWAAGVIIQLAGIGLLHAFVRRTVRYTALSGSVGEESETCGIWLYDDCVVESRGIGDVIIPYEACKRVRETADVLYILGPVSEAAVFRSRDVTPAEAVPLFDILRARIPAAKWRVQKPFVPSASQRMEPFQYRPPKAAVITVYCRVRKATLQLQQLWRAFLEFFLLLMGSLLSQAAVEWDENAREYLLTGVSAGSIGAAVVLAVLAAAYSGVIYLIVIAITRARYNRKEGTGILSLTPDGIFVKSTFWTRKYSWKYVRVRYVRNTLRLYVPSRLGSVFEAAVPADSTPEYERFHEYAQAMIRDFSERPHQ